MADYRVGDVYVNDDTIFLTPDDALCHMANSDFFYSDGTVDTFVQQNNLAIAIVVKKHAVFINEKPIRLVDTFEEAEIVMNRFKSASIQMSEAAYNEQVSPIKLWNPKDLLASMTVGDDEEEASSNTAETPIRVLEF